MSIFTIILLIIAGILLGPWVFDLVGLIFGFISKAFYFLGNIFDVFDVSTIFDKVVICYEL